LVLEDSDGTVVTRTPLIVHEDGSLTYAGDVPQGQSVSLSFGNREAILRESRSMHGYESDVLLLFSCVGRRAFLGRSYMDKSLTPFTDTPNSGFYTYGEVLN